MFILFLYFWGFSQINRTVNSDRGRGVFICGNILFPVARKSIKIVAGALNPSFYGHLTIIHALQEAQKRGVNIQIIFSYPKDKKDKEVRNKIENLISENGKLSFLKKGENLLISSHFIEDPHFTIVDGLHARLEEIHAPFWKREKGEKVTAWLYFWSPVLAQTLLSKFNFYLKNYTANNNAS